MVSHQENATWTASNPGPADIHQRVAFARVSARHGIVLEVTASVDPLLSPPGYDRCGTQARVVAAPGRDIRWCYRIRNDSSIARTLHTLDSDRHGPVLTDFPFELASGASVFITFFETLGMSDLIERATWTASRPGPTHESISIDQARARVEGRVFADGFE